MIKLEDVGRGYSRWAAKPHNAKWVRRIDGTPIANDICANIFDELSSVSLSPTSTDALVVALKAWEAWEAKLIMEGSDQLWCELGDLAELQGIRNSALYSASPSPVSADAVVEACAKVAEDHTPYKRQGTLAAHVTGTAISRAIRALKGTFPAVDGWRTMDSAPKDGTPFVAINIRYLTGHHITIYKWDGPPNYWHAKQQGTCIRPDYQDDYRWIPLPAARSALVDPEGGV